MSDDVAGPLRVRIAPSPTGYFHVGTGRAALWNWLLARRHGGTFILRIEDTDAERNQEESVEGIYSAMRWLGLDWDEGPYRQSERGELYVDAADKLWASGHLYACDCTREVVEERTKGNATPGYDGFCRDRGLPRGPGVALRFRVADEGTTVVRDLIRGDVEFANSTIEDFVVVRSSGVPLFVLAVVVDDIEMRISHVVRGEEHLPTAPKSVMLMKALGVEPPAYAHVPVLVNEKRQKISKRRDKVAMEDYRAQGYLPAAMRNFLCILGWSPRDGREFLTLDEMVDEFSLANVNHSPAFFDEKKLNHFNGVYIRQMGDAEFTSAAMPFLPDWTEPGSGADTSALDRLLPLAKERITTLGELGGYLRFALPGDLEIDPASAAKALDGDEGAGEILRAALERFSAVPFEPEALKAEAEAIAEAVGRKLAKAQAPIRVATMGATVGLPLFESLAVLGRERTLERLQAALAGLAAAAPAESPGRPPDVSPAGSAGISPAGSPGISPAGSPGPAA